MRWFGPTPFSMACDGVERAPVPLDEHCAWCEEGFTHEDSGYLIPHTGSEDEALELPWHEECHLRQVIGSVAHIERRCSCFGGPAAEGDPPELSKRDGARAACVAYRRMPARWQR